MVQICLSVDADEVVGISSRMMLLQKCEKECRNAEVANMRNAV